MSAHIVIPEGHNSMQTHAKTNVTTIGFSVRLISLSLGEDNGSGRTKNTKIVPVRNCTDDGYHGSARQRHRRESQLSKEK
jgi:hypothetical protein